MPSLPHIAQGAPCKALCSLDGTVRQTSGWCAEMVLLCVCVCVCVCAAETVSLSAFTRPFKQVIYTSMALGVAGAFLFAGTYVPTRSGA